MSENQIPSKYKTYMNTQSSKRKTGSIVNYLTYLDKLKKEYIQEKRSLAPPELIYLPSQFYYYQPLFYCVPGDIIFRQALLATKLQKNAILFYDTINNTKVYFTDKDVSAIIFSIGNRKLKDHIVGFLKKVIEGEKLENISFIIAKKTFTISGIPFAPEFNVLRCENPAGIDLNGNDLIALINLRQHRTNATIRVIP